MQRQKVIGFSGTRRGVPDRIIKEIFEYLSQKYKTFEVVVGDCIGVDEQVYRFCKENGILVKVIAVRNNWNKISYKPRDEDIIEYVGSKDERLKRKLAGRTIRLIEYLSEKKGYLIAIPDSSSKGTKLAVKKAREIGVPVEVFYVD